MVCSAGQDQHSLAKLELQPGRLREPGPAPCAAKSPPQTPTGDSQHQRNSHGHISGEKQSRLNQRPHTPSEKPWSPRGLPSTRTASLRRADMEISPHRRGSGDRNRNVWEQMDSTEGPVCADKGPSQQVGGTASPWHLGKAHPQAPGPAAHSSPSQPCAGRAAGPGHTCPVLKPMAHGLTG